jgi:hypothetical protein
MFRSCERSLDFGVLPLARLRESRLHTHSIGAVKIMAMAGILESHNLSPAIWKLDDAELSSTLLLAVED